MSAHTFSYYDREKERHKSCKMHSPNFASGASGFRSSPGKRRRARTILVNGKGRRRSVQNLIDGFSLLRSHLPSYSSGRQLTQIETLRLAMIYINDLNELLERTNCATRQDVDTLRFDADDCSDTNNAFHAGTQLQRQLACLGVGSDGISQSAEREATSSILCSRSEAHERQCSTTVLHRSQPKAPTTANCTGVLAPQRQAISPLFTSTDLLSADVSEMRQLRAPCILVSPSKC